ncbi:MAG: hypothetical protein ACP5I8_12205 [Phycisphaerae bacterium]
MKLERKMWWGITACTGIAVTGICAIVILNIHNSTQYTRSLSAELSIRWCKSSIEWASRPGRSVADIQFALDEAASYADGADRLLLPPGTSGSLTHSVPWLGWVALVSASKGKYLLNFYWLDYRTDDVRGFYLQYPNKHVRYFGPTNFERTSRYPPLVNLVHMTSIPVEISAGNALSADDAASGLASFRRPAVVVTLSRNDISSRLIAGLLLRHNEESNSVLVTVSKVMERHYAK